MILFQIKLNLPSTWRKWQTWRTWQNVGPTITCLETQFVTLHEGTSFSDTPISQWIFLGIPMVSLDPKNHQKPIASHSHWFIGSQKAPSTAPQASVPSFQGPGSAPSRPSGRRRRCDRAAPATPPRWWRRVQHRPSHPATDSPRLVPAPSD